MRSYVVKGVKSNDVKSIKIDNIASKRIDAAIKKVKIDTKDSCSILKEGKILSSKLPKKSVAQD